MVNLFAGCSRSKVTVIPSNWNVVNPGPKVLNKLLSQPWRIYYRFYDPAFKGTKQWGKLIVIKGMNEYETLQDRQDITKGLLETEIDLLDRQGYNPLTKQFMAPIPDEQVYEISPKALVMDALEEGRKKLDVVHDTMIDIKSVLKGVAKAAEQLFDNTEQKRYSALSISQKQVRFVRTPRTFDRDSQNVYHASTHLHTRRYGYGWPLLFYCRHRGKEDSATTRNTSIMYRKHHAR